MTYLLWHGLFAFFCHHIILNVMVISYCIVITVYGESYYRPCRFERWYLRRRFYCVKHDKYPNNGYKDHFNKFINSQAFIWWMAKKCRYYSPLNSNEWTLSFLCTLYCWCLFGQYLKTKRKWYNQTIHEYCS